MRSLATMLRVVAGLAAVMTATACVSSAPATLTEGGASNATGPITFATGTDLTGYLQPLLDRWNATHPGEHVKLLEVAEDADDQRAQLVTNLQARSDRYDVMSLDVIWTAEFAEAGWIVPLDRRQFPLSEFLKPVVDTAVYHGTLYAVPYTSNAGLLYYRSDVLGKEGKQPPRTWAELRDLAKNTAPKYGLNGYAGQFLPYEGLTVNVAEAVQSAGGGILSEDGSKVVVDSPQARTGLDFLVQGFREGWIPKEALGYKEEDSRRAFQSGKLLFLRNWPYAYRDFAMPAPDNPVQGRFGVVPLPGPNGPGSSSLGGANLAISAFSRHRKTALEFTKFMTSYATQREVLTQGSFPPVWARLYDDPDLIRGFPYLPVLKESILAARPRPASPNYNQVSLIISSAAYSALILRKPPDAALAEMSTDLKSPDLSN